jgi:hypothetical protein
MSTNNSFKTLSLALVSMYRLYLALLIPRVQYFPSLYKLFNATSRSDIFLWRFINLQRMRSEASIKSFISQFANDKR